MWADVVTTEMKMSSGLKSVLLDNVLDLPRDKINLVQAVDGEIHMKNIRNRKVWIAAKD